MQASWFIGVFFSGLYRIDCGGSNVSRVYRVCGLFGHIGGMMQGLQVFRSSGLRSFISGLRRHASSSYCLLQAVIRALVAETCVAKIPAAQGNVAIWGSESLLMRFPYGPYLILLE